MMFTANDRIHLSIQFIIVTLAVTANIILLVVIKMRTPSKMRVFSIFLVNNAIVDLISAISGGLACSRFINVLDGSVNIFIGPCSLLGVEFCLLNQCESRTSFFAIQAVLHNFSSFLLLLTFIYRLYVLRVSQPLRQAKIGIWIMCIVSWAPAVVQIYLYYSIAGDVPVEVSKSLDVMGHLSRKFPKADSPEGAIGILPTGLISPVCMIGSCVVRLLLERYLKTHKDHDHHRGVIRTLTYQMMLPLGSLIGTTYWFFDMTYQLHAEWPGRMLMMINCSICLASPIINLLCLPPYRRALPGWQISRTMSQVA